VELKPSKQTAQFKTWPNPFREEFNIEGDWENDQEISVRLFTQNGRMVAEQSFVATESRESISMQSLGQLAPGMYVVRIMSGDKILYNNKLLKQ
jgi:hypothetical protein